MEEQARREAQQKLNANLVTGFATPLAPSRPTSPTNPSGPTIAVPNNTTATSAVINGTLHNSKDWQKAFGVGNNQNNKLGIDMNNWQPSSANNSNSIPFPDSLNEKERKEQFDLANTKPNFIPQVVDDYVKANADNVLNNLSIASRGMYPVSSKLLEDALNGKGQNRYYNNTSYISIKISNNPVFKKHMSDFISKVGPERINAIIKGGEIGEKIKKEINVIDPSYEFSAGQNEDDLYYSVGKYSFQIKDIKRNDDNSNTIYLTIKDNYDFDSYRNGSGKGSYMNNLGYITQLRKQLMPYSLEIDVNYTYKEKS